MYIFDIHSEIIYGELSSCLAKTCFRPMFLHFFRKIIAEKWKRKKIPYEKDVHLNAMENYHLIHLCKLRKWWIVIFSTIHRNVSSTSEKIDFSAAKKKRNVHKKLFSANKQKIWKPFTEFSFLQLLTQAPLKKGERKMRRIISHWNAATENEWDWMNDNC